MAAFHWNILRLEYCVSIYFYDISVYSAPTIFVQVNSLDQRIIWKYTRLFILDISLSFVVSVVKHLLGRLKYVIMSAPTLVKSHINASFAVRPLANALTCSLTRELLTTTTSGTSVRNAGRASSVGGKNLHI